MNVNAFKIHPCGSSGLHVDYSKQGERNMIYGFILKR